MIRNILIALAVVSTSVAQEFSPYVSLSGGAAFLKVDDRDAGSNYADNGAVAEGAVGLTYREDVDTSTLRAELALSFQKDDLDDVDVDVETVALMVNGYFDIATETAFTPYFLAGVGRANVDIGVDDAYAFAYQFGGGLGYSLTEHVILDLKYKYFVTDEIERVKFATQQVQLGVRYQF